MAKTSKRVAVIVPAHNEQALLATSLAKLRKIVQAKDLFVVDDGSHDKTSQIARKFTAKVLRLTKNGGKGKAINAALIKWKLTEKYEYIMPLDADTEVSKDFFSIVLKRFETGDANKIACVIGRVDSRFVNWLTIYRIWEYEIGQTIHKQAQSFLGGIVVGPGCATVYRSKVLKKTKFPTKSLAEDMALSFLIHRKRLGKIVYEPKAIVVTQDPLTLADYLKQIDRWYTGLWQNIFKYNLPWEGQMLDFEVALTVSEGLFSGLMYLSLLMLLPLSMMTDPTLFIVLFLIDVLIFFIPSLVYVAWKKKSWRLFEYMGQFYILRVVSSMFFLKSFLKVMWAKDGVMKWYSPKRYKFRMIGS